MPENQDDQGFQGQGWTNSVATRVKNVEAEVASLRGGVGALLDVRSSGLWEMQRPKASDTEFRDVMSLRDIKRWKGEGSEAKRLEREQPRT